jgi:hypothetical protein
MYDLNTLQIFAVIDRTGTTAQLTLDDVPENPVEIGDTGVYNGMNDGKAVALDFTVSAVNDPNNIVITTMTPDGGPGKVMASRWPSSGYIVWATGANVGVGSPDPEVIAMNPANAYIDPTFLAQYAGSRTGALYSYQASPLDQVEQAIVMASDYLDQRFRYKGIRIWQFFTSDLFGAGVIGVDPWLYGGFNDFFGFYGSFNSYAWLVPLATQQHLQWPRQGVIDYSGDQVYGVPLPLKQACAELALRILAGQIIQPDFDPTVFANPIRSTVSFDTKFGTAYFPPIPQVQRILSQAGLLLASGGRSIVR